MEQARFEAELDAVTRELKQLRRDSLCREKWWCRTPVLVEIATELDRGIFPPPEAVRLLLRNAAHQIDGGGAEADAADLLFGIERVQRVRILSERRTAAASRLGVKEEAFRRRRESRVIHLMAHEILTLRANFRIGREFDPLKLYSTNYCVIVEEM